MLPKISVVIPVYNVENYLHRCIDSILNQSFQDFEILLIDDGSKDRSGQICDEYAQKDQRIKVVHKKNARVSAARNDGMKMAKGKYISFIDSDDWIEPDMYQVMISKAEDFYLDIIMCDYNKQSKNYVDKRTQPIRGGYYSKENIRNELFDCLIMFENIEYPPTISNWVCIFNLEFLKSNYLFYDEEIHYDEDSLFGSKAMYHATNFYYLKDSYFYNYFFNPTSTTNTYNGKKWDSFIKINEQFVKYFENIKEYDFTRQIKINMLYLTFSALGQIKYSDTSRNERLNMIKNIMGHPRVMNIFNNFKLPKVSWKLKIIILLIKFKMAKLYSLILLRDKAPNTIHFADEGKLKNGIKGH